MRLAATAAMVAQGYAAETVTFSEGIDLRLEGQDASLQIPFSGAFDAALLRPAFITAYRDTYGYAPTDAVEAVALRLQARAHASEPLDFTALKTTHAAVGIGEERRMVCFGRAAATDTPIMRRAAVTGPLTGPVIIQESDTTIVIPPGARVEPDATGSLVAIVEAAS
jgi:N-methylhydantoinase A